MDDIRVLWSDKVSDTCNPKPFKIRVTLYYWLPWLITLWGRNPMVTLTTYSTEFSWMEIPRFRLKFTEIYPQGPSRQQTSVGSDTFLTWISDALLPSLDELNALTMFGTWKWKMICRLFNWQHLNSWFGIYGSPWNSLIYWYPICGWVVIKTLKRHQNSSSSKGRYRYIAKNISLNFYVEALNTCTWIFHWPINYHLNRVVILSSGNMT